EDIWQALQEKAIPLVDTVNSVLRRMLGLPGGGERGSHAPLRRNSAGRAHGRTPQQEYRLPILCSLYRAGGSSPASKVLDEVEAEMGDRLNEVDRQKLNSGRDIRWRNAAMWERAVMVKEGLLKDYSPRGIWELTEEGERAAQQTR
ncbi:unnamed protein product, partial [marine sediment metagenome]